MSQTWCLSAAAGSAGGGTTDYMPMEQLNSYMHPAYLPPNHHQGLADVYSLGISLWEMLVGRDPLARVLQCTRPRLDLDSRKADLLRFQLKQDLVSAACCHVSMHGTLAEK